MRWEDDFQGSYFFPAPQIKKGDEGKKEQVGLSVFWGSIDWFSKVCVIASIIHLIFLSLAHKLASKNPESIENRRCPDKKVLHVIRDKNKIKHCHGKIA